MFITIEGFGSIWSKRVRRDPNRQGGQLIAYYNTTGVSVNGWLRHRSRLFGQLRFNQGSGFNAHIIERNVGRVFESSLTVQPNGVRLLLHHLSDGPVLPDYFLFAITSDRTGALPIGYREWKSDGVLLLSFSEFKQNQEAIILMPANSWIQGALGYFVAEPLTNISWRAFLRLVR